MELSLPMKLRIAASVATGVVLIGILVWPLAAPPEPFGVVSLAAGSMTSFGAVILAALAFLAGFIAYFVSWPYGREIGILAAPAGLSVWAVRSGTMASVFQLNPSAAQRQEIAASLRFEPVVWLFIVAAGFAGVLLGQRIRPSLQLKDKQEKPKSEPGIYLNAVAALAGSAFIALNEILGLTQSAHIFTSRRSFLTLAWSNCLNLSLAKTSRYSL